MFHLEKYTRGGKMIISENWGGGGGGGKGLCAAAHPVGGSGGMPPQKNFGFLDPLRSLVVHFSDHLWFQMIW